MDILHLLEKIDILHMMEVMDTQHLSEVMVTLHLAVVLATEHLMEVIVEDHGLANKEVGQGGARELHSSEYLFDSSDPNGSAMLMMSFLVPLC